MSRLAKLCAFAAGLLTPIARIARLLARELCASYCCGAYPAPRASSGRYRAGFCAGVEVGVGVGMTSVNGSGDVEIFSFGRMGSASSSAGP